MLIKDMLGLPNDIKGDVGVEIEVEGEDLVVVADRDWNSVPDGSLRNGIEYITKGAVSLQHFPTKLSRLKDKLKDSKLSFSFRTSVHVHVNCLELTYKQTLNFIYLSTLMDSILVNYCGDSRKANRFCLRLRDAEGMVDNLKGLFARSGDRPVFFRRVLPQNQLRYAAINVESLGKYGTVEFRSMRGTLDQDILIPWVETLVHMREFAKTFESPTAMFNSITEEGSEEFIRHALGAHYKAFEYPDMVSDFALNLSLSIELPHTERIVFNDTLYDINGREYNTDELIAGLRRTPSWKIIKTLAEQGAFDCPLLRDYFDWAYYEEEFEELANDGYDYAQEIVDYLEEM